MTLDACLLKLLGGLHYLDAKIMHKLAIRCRKCTEMSKAMMMNQENNHNTGKALDSSSNSSSPSLPHYTLLLQLFSKLDSAHLKCLHQLGSLIRQRVRARVVYKKQLLFQAELLAKTGVWKRLDVRDQIKLYRALPPETKRKANQAVRRASKYLTAEDRPYIKENPYGILKPVAEVYIQKKKMGMSAKQLEERFKKTHKHDIEVVPMRMKRAQERLKDRHKAYAVARLEQFAVEKSVQQQMKAVGIKQKTLRSSRFSVNTTYNSVANYRENRARAAEQQNAENEIKGDIGMNNYEKQWNSNSSNYNKAMSKLQNQKSSHLLPSSQTEFVIFRKPRWETYTGRLSGNKLVYENQMEVSRLNMKDDLYDCELPDGEVTVKSKRDRESIEFLSSNLTPERGDGARKESGADENAREVVTQSKMDRNREPMQQFLEIVRRM